MPKIGTTQQQADIYEEERQKEASRYRLLVSMLLGGKLSSETYRQTMRDDLRTYYLRCALLGKGERQLTALDRRDLRRFLAGTYKFLDGFVDDLRSFKTIASEDQAAARSELYANAWNVVTRYAIPGALADALPALPGVDCLGGAACGCFLEYEQVDRAYHVYWHVNPMKQHCIFCSEFAADWTPLVVTLDDIGEALDGEDIGDEDWEL